MVLLSYEVITSPIEFKWVTAKTHFKSYKQEPTQKSWEENQEMSDLPIGHWYD